MPNKMAALLLLFPVCFNASRIRFFSASPQTFSLHDEAAEKKRILEALKQTGNNKSKAAILLGIDRKTLYNKLKLYDIQ